MKYSKKHICIKKCFLYAGIISSVLAGASYLTLITKNETPVADEISYGQRVLECEQAASKESCLNDLITMSVQEGKFQVLAADLSKSNSLNMTCTKVIHMMSGEDLLAIMNPVNIIANTDTPACNGALAEQVMPTYVKTLDEKGWGELASSCMKRAAFSVPGKTTACAKGLGWAVASVDGLFGREFDRCRELIEHAVVDTGMNWETDDLGRYIYGCAHGIVMAHHAPHANAQNYRPVSVLLGECKKLLNTEGRDAMSLRSGCAGGLGTALGQRIWEEGENTKTGTEEGIVECSSLVGNLDANAPEWQCVHQIYRQNAYTIFVEKSEADLYCNKIHKENKHNIALICKEEAERRFAN